MSMTERQWQTAVEHLLTLYGWRWYHAPDNLPSRDRSQRRQTVVRGFPDLVAIKGTRILYVELKKEGSYPSPEQREWLAALHAAGAEVGVWWPHDKATAIRVLGPRQERLVLPIRYRPETLGNKDLPAGGTGHSV